MAAAGMLGWVLGGVALGLAGTVALWTIGRVRRGCFDPREDLPLGLCNLSAVIAPAQAFSHSPLLAAWAICLGGPGGLVSLAMPDLEPHHDRATRIKFWIVHLGLVLYALLCALLFAPRGGSGLIAALLAAGVAVLFATAALNRLLDANYWFLRDKPATPSLLDWFGPWPVYTVPMVGTAAAIAVMAFAAWSALWR